MSSAPRVVQCTAVPSAYLQEAHDRGDVRLTVWTPREDEAHLTTAPRDWLLEHAPGASALLVVLQNRVDADVLDRAGDSLRVVSTMSVGYDHIDLDACKQRNVRVGYTPGVLNEAVADTAVLLALMGTRHALPASRLVTDGRWPKTPMRPLTLTGPSLEGKTIGFVGFGAIAQSTVRRLASFRPRRVVYAASKPKPFDVHSAAFAPLLDDVLGTYVRAHGRLPFDVENVQDVGQVAAEADVLIVLANYVPSTHHIVNADVLQRMKKTATIVNVARGPLVDTDALVDALHRDAIAGVALDVIEGEPQITPEHPLLAPALADKVVLLPHVGSATTEARQSMANYATLNVLAALGLRPGSEKDTFCAELDLSK
ncbi:hypothetical protein MBRA1_001359 [Malassezia brasiliensis]|uniref:Glyoxylate reductase n=1 Tax=Malassezia brasiliensis TaxID=1821822 RepID=A0AAF0IPA7_9BASI|nr:hypothetical protein MBRA1_001359 [Malassezia brasiliensis]